MLNETQSVELQTICRLRSPLSGPTLWPLTSGAWGWSLPPCSAACHPSKMQRFAAKTSVLCGSSEAHTSLSGRKEVAVTCQTDVQLLCRFACGWKAQVYLLDDSEGPFENGETTATPRGTIAGVWHAGTDPEGQVSLPRVSVPSRWPSAEAHAEKKPSQAYRAGRHPRPPLPAAAATREHQRFGSPTPVLRPEKHLKQCTGLLRRQEQGEVSAGREPYLGATIPRQGAPNDSCFSLMARIRLEEGVAPSRPSTADSLAYTQGHDSALCKQTPFALSLNCSRQNAVRVL